MFWENAALWEDMTFSCLTARFYGKCSEHDLNRNLVLLNKILCDPEQTNLSKPLQHLGKTNKLRCPLHRQNVENGPR